MKINKWDTWQTFRKDRGTPPWIKVHRNLLTNIEWVSLSDAEKGQLVSMWILAADKNGIIPDDPKVIQRMAMLDKQPNLNKFIDLGFLTVTCQSHDGQVVTMNDNSDAPEKSRVDKSREESKKRRSALSADLELAKDWQEYCKTKRPELNPEVVFENFKSYYISEGKLMMNWAMTWQRWVRNERPPKGNGYQAPEIFSQAFQAADFSGKAEALLDPVDPYAALKGDMT